MAGLLKVERHEAILQATIRRWAATPCSPHPCGEEVWRYACEMAGVAMAQLPVHDSDRAKARLLRREGGLTAYAGRLVTGIGWQEIDDPWQAERGDVGVVAFPGQRMLTCAICLGDSGLKQRSGRPDNHWMAKGDGFTRTEPAEPWTVWRLPCPRL